MAQDAPVTIVGGGLAGSEAASVLAAAGVPVRLFEMRPQRMTPAHRTGELAEVVCSNSLGSTLRSTGKGVLLAELERLGSLVLGAARACAVPAGASLAIDREAFSSAVGAALGARPEVQLVREEVCAVPARGPVILASGPLTSDALARSLAAVSGTGHLAFYDAIAPVVSAESLDHEVVFPASRWGKGAPDFLNCPLDGQRYEAFVEALLAAEKVPLHAFEEPRYFEGCLPIEVLAERGRQTLAFGPMRPAGLVDPRTGRRPHAVVQLRREDRHGQLYNLVGFQTKLRHGEQKRVLRMIPGLERAEFVRLGSIHRNTFLNAPAVLAPDLSLRARDDVWVAGLLAGVEGYAECAALGLVAALAVLARRAGRPFVPPPPTSMLGALLLHLREADPAHFQPMNVNFGLLPPLEGARLPRGRAARREALAERALTACETWIEEQDLSWLSGARLGAPA